MVRIRTQALQITVSRYCFSLPWVSVWFLLIFGKHETPVLVIGLEDVQSTGDKRFDH